MNAAIQEVWIHGVLTEFGIHTSPSVDLFCDNQSEIKISIDLVQKQKTKHIEVHMHYIRELVHNKAIIQHYFPTEEQIANIFTKSFTEKRFVYIRYLPGVNV